MEQSEKYSKLGRELFLKRNEHGLLSSSFYRYNKEKDSFESIKMKDLKQNDIFLKIDVSDAKSNKNLFISHGFVIRDTINDPEKVVCSCLFEEE